jgi:hypothetical protein
MLILIFVELLPWHFYVIAVKLAGPVMAQPTWTCVYGPGGLTVKPTFDF